MAAHDPAAAVQPRYLMERPVQLPPGRWALWLMHRMGWKLHFGGLPALQGVIVVYPHTSNVDFPVGVLAKWAMGLQAKFWGKHTLFRIPLFGAWLRWMGGIAVDRRAPGGVVDQAAQAMLEAKREQRMAWLALAPEGTRSYTEGWRSGFYRVALRAELPVGVAAIDYRRKEVRLMHFLELCGDEAADMAAIASALEQPVGYTPANASPLRLL